MTVAAILAAGRGVRFGADKTEAMLGGKPVWRWSLDTFLSHPDVDRVILVTSPDKVEEIRSVLPPEVLVIPGGETRQESSFKAVVAADPADIVLIHDAARPFVSKKVISDTIKGIQTAGAAAAALPVVDTIKEKTDSGIKSLDRTKLVSMQTPQGALRTLLLLANSTGNTGATDEMAQLETIGVNPIIVDGEPNNFKITTPEDLTRARSILGAGESRTGIGYDIHPISDDPNRNLFLGGVHFPEHPALEGHSDADVLLHAACDALLGAASLGDIGQHFKNTDPQWKNCSSIVFVQTVGRMLKEVGWTITNLDMTLISESPKIMKKADEIRNTVALALAVDASRINVKATTNEKLGSLGRSEGMAAFAVATITGVF